MLSDLWSYERAAWESGFKVVGGVDEVGRGPLAGPVVAACVVLPRDFDIEGITDSKTLTEAQRERANERIRSGAMAYQIASIEPAEIDRLNILKATHKAMAQAIESLAVSLDIVLVDGLPVPNLPCKEQRAIVRGDSASASIAAASIIAKVYRDHLMEQYHETYPNYGFDSHKGYGSKRHLNALNMHGPCPIHRMSFSPMNSLFFGNE